MPDYRTFVGLALNADRARVRKLWDYTTAFAIAGGSMEVPEEWATHLTETDEEAREFNRKRVTAELRAKVLGGLN